MDVTAFNRLEAARDLEAAGFGHKRAEAVAKAVTTTGTNAR